MNKLGILINVSNQDTSSLVILSYNPLIKKKNLTFEMKLDIIKYLPQYSS